MRGDIPPAEFIPIAEHSGLDHRARRMGAAPRLHRRQGLAGHHDLGQRFAAAIPPLRFRRRRRAHPARRPSSIRPGSSSKSPKARSSAMSTPPSSRCSGSRRWASGSRSTISAPAIRACSICAASRSTSSRSIRSFVRSIERAADAAAIVHAVVSLGRGLGMKVTAEGVETAEQQLFLRAAGVHSMQGYRFGRPGQRPISAGRLASPGLLRMPPTTRAGLAMAG